MADIIKNVSMFGNVQHNVNLPHPFNYSDFVNKTNNLIDLKPHFLSKNEPILLVKKSTYKKKQTPQKYNKKESSKTTNSREGKSYFIIL